jgi:hypothetical protein
MWGCILKSKIKSKRTVAIKRGPKATVVDAPDLITIVLLCDSPGYRMKSYGALPLIAINEKYKLIDLQIHAIQQAFKNFEIILCIGFDAEKICKYVRSKYNKLNIRIVENQLFESSNSCESTRVAINNTFNHKLLICDGNLLLNKQVLSLIDDKDSCILVENKPSDNLEIKVNVDDKHQAQYFSFGAHRTWSEIVFLNTQESIEIFRKFLSSHDNKNKFIFEALNELVRSRVSLRCIYNENTLHKISNIKTYRSIKELT